MYKPYTVYGTDANVAKWRGAEISVYITVQHVERKQRSVWIQIVKISQSMYCTVWYLHLKEALQRSF